jgi:hypothetical protein
MAKIWEVDFTEFDPPSSLQAVDKVGTENLPAATGSITKANPLPGFNFRPGVTFIVDNVNQR